MLLQHAILMKGNLQINLLIHYFVRHQNDLDINDKIRNAQNFASLLARLSVMIVRECVCIGFLASKMVLNIHRLTHVFCILFFQLHNDIQHRLSVTVNVTVK